MAVKGLDLFDECAARGACLYSEEEECTSFSRGVSKRYTYGAIANS